MISLQGSQLITGCFLRFFDITALACDLVLVACSRHWRLKMREWKWKMAKTTSSVVTLGASMAL